MLKLFKFLKPYRTMVASILVLVFIQSLAELYLPTLMSDIVNNGMLKGRYSLYMEDWGLYAACSIWKRLGSSIEQLFICKDGYGLWKGH